MATDEPVLAAAPLIELDEEGRVACINQAAAAALGVSPLTVLGVSSSSLPAGWERFAPKEPPVLAVADRELPDSLLWEAAALAPSLEEAFPLFESLARSEWGTAPHGVWILSRGYLAGASIRPDVLSEGPELEKSYALRFGRSVTLDGRSLLPVQGWPVGVASSSWPIYIGTQIVGLVAASGDPARAEAFAQRFRISLIPHFLPR